MREKDRQAGFLRQTGGTRHVSRSEECSCLFFKDLCFAFALLFTFQKTPHVLLLSWHRRHISALSHRERYLNEVCGKVPSRRLVARAFDTWPGACRFLA